MNRLAAAALAALVPATGNAQMISECSWVTSARNIVEPWEENTRTFAKGAIRVTRLDTGGEPACCSQYLMLTMPHPEGGQACYMISGGSSELGFLDILFGQMTSAYDPAEGLSITVPVVSMAPDGAAEDPLEIRLVANQAQGGLDIGIVGEVE